MKSKKCFIQLWFSNSIFIIIIISMNLYMGENLILEKEA